MTIHSNNPFREPTSDPVRRLRARLGGAVTLWTSGTGDDRAGLTVSSVMAATGEPGRLLALLDPDSDLAERITATNRAVVSLLGWQHRALADAFAGQGPAPGGPFTLGAWIQTPAGPMISDALGHALVTVESQQPVGWSLLVTAVVDDCELAEEGAPDAEALGHRRGRYFRLDGR